jgi:hypothetical protein
MGLLPLVSQGCANWRIVPRSRRLHLETSYPSGDGLYVSLYPVPVIYVFFLTKVYSTDFQVTGQEKRIPPIPIR